MLGTIMCFERLHLTLYYVSFASIVRLTCLVSLPCRWLQKILKITRSIASSFFLYFVRLLHIVFLHWFVYQVRFVLKFSLFLELSFHSLWEDLSIILLDFVWCFTLLYCSQSFQWAYELILRSLSLNSNLSLSWIPLYGRFGTQKEILLKLGWTFYWRCWKTFRCNLFILLALLKF